MRNLSNADIAFLSGNGPKVVSSVPLIRKQRNGKLTGFVRQTYSDGAIAEPEFIVNADTRDEVVAAFAASGLAA